MEVVQYHDKTVYKLYINLFYSPVGVGWVNLALHRSSAALLTARKVGREAILLHFQLELVSTGLSRGGGGGQN